MQENKKKDTNLYIYIYTYTETLYLLSSLLSACSKLCYLATHLSWFFSAVSLIEDFTVLFFVSPDNLRLMIKWPLFADRHELIQC